VISVLIAVAISFVGAEARAASSTCGPTAPENFFVGVKQVDPPGVGLQSDGIQANIEARSPDLCSTVTPRFEVQSPQIYRSNGTGLAQIGVLKDLNFSHLVFFWQWVKDATAGPSHSGVWGQPDLLTKYNFKVTRLAADGHLHMLYLNPDVTPDCKDGFCPHTDFDPHVEWNDNFASVFSEVNRPGSDAAGQAGSKADYTAILIRPTGGNWQDPVAWTPDNDRTCYFNRETVHAFTNFVTYTNPIAHGTSC